MRRRRYPIQDEPEAVTHLMPISQASVKAYIDHSHQTRWRYGLLCWILGLIAGVVIGVTAATSATNDTNEPKIGTALTQEKVRSAYTGPDGIRRETDCTISVDNPPLKVTLIECVEITP